MHAYDYNILHESNTNTQGKPHNVIEMRDFIKTHIEGGEDKSGDTSSSNYPIEAESNNSDEFRGDLMNFIKNWRPMDRRAPSTDEVSRRGTGKTEDVYKSENDKIEDLIFSPGEDGVVQSYGPMEIGHQAESADQKTTNNIHAK